MAEQAAARAFAAAKVNLYLHVTGQRADGLHDLDSLVVFAGVGDDIEASLSEDLSLSIDGPFGPAIPGGPDNLVLRAARGLAELCGVPARAAIRLTKRLPVAAGIGGGSADAAATIRALTGLWQVSPNQERLMAMAMALGADVPVCLHDRPTFVGGAGEGLDPAPGLPPAWLVLANPLREAPTGAVFKARRGAFSPPARFTSQPADARALAELLESRVNDLEAAACTVAPAAGKVLDALSKLPGGLLTRMSGSGATGFALFETEEAASAAADMLCRARPEWWVAAAPILAPEGGVAWTSITSGAT